MPDRVSRKIRRTFFGLLTLAVGLALSGPSAHAAPFQFNPNPFGSDTSWPREVAGLDFPVGNVLAQGAVPAFAAGDGATFQLYYQAKLVGAIPVTQGGTTISPTGINRDFEITVVASVTQMVTSPPGSSLITFQAVPTEDQSDESFFRIYYDAPPNAMDASGTGFEDGTLILSAAPMGGVGGNFSITGQDGQSVIGLGSLKIFAQVLDFDPEFFDGEIPEIALQGQLGAPLSATPAAQLTDILGAPVIPNTGPINGSTGPDFRMDLDASLSAVPEPSSLVLSGLGLLGLLALSRRQRRSS